MQIPLPDFSKVNVLVVGDLMLDRYWFGDTVRISPEAPVPVVKVKQMDDRPGGAGNVALNVAALGAKVAVIGITGNDEAATKLKDQLAAAHVQYDIHQVAHIRTITKLRVISRHQQLLRLDMEDVFPEMDQEHLIHAFQKHLKHAEHLPEHEGSLSRRIRAARANDSVKSLSSINSAR